jgi:hypothetical protein
MTDVALIGAGAASVGPRIWAPHRDERPDIIDFLTMYPDRGGGSSGARRGRCEGKDAEPLTVCQLAESL